MSSDESCRPVTALWVEAHLAHLNTLAVPYYFIQKGNYASGTVLLKLNGLKGSVRLLVQQRDFMTGALGWADALGEEHVEERRADSYIKRAIEDDPDLWAIEIESADMKNPFEA